MNPTTLRKPAWLNKKINLKDCQELKQYLKDLNIHTVCQEALCPNISECFKQKRATFLILGNNCTRCCTFCNIKREPPLALDYIMIKRIKQAVKRLNLTHVVITSVTRDDLKDAGAEYFKKAIDTLHTVPKLTIELLIPDFFAKKELLKIIVDAKPHIIGHNIETISKLYPILRKGSDYNRCLSVLKIIKKINPSMLTKSGIMLGLGETQKEVLTTLSDIRSTGCDFLSIGQYLAPSKKHAQVKRFIPIDEFDFYKKHALKIGFRHVASSPYVRSSYLAEQYIDSIDLSIC